MTRRFVLVAILILVAACAAAQSTVPAHRVVFSRERAHASLYGFLRFTPHGHVLASAVAIGPRTVLTLGHCFTSEIGTRVQVSCCGYWLLRGDAPPINAHLVEARGDLLGACALRVPERLPCWLETGAPEEGWAVAITMAGDYNIRLARPPSVGFTGWRPYAGASGSPIVQYGRVVGLLMAQSTCPKHARAWAQAKKRPPECKCTPLPDEGAYAPLGTLEGLR